MLAAHGERRPQGQWGGISARQRLLFEIGYKVNAHVGRCTHDGGSHHIAHDGALEAEPRLLKQTRNFLLHQRAAANQTFQAPPVRRCDARAPDGDTEPQSQNLPSPIQFQSYW
jgi:hypothetical protein